jgi:hypothetical protein
MNKFNIPNPSGGHGLMAHDLNLIYDYLAEGMSGLALKESAILTGCRINTDLVTASITPGFVTIAGEVYRVEAQSWAVSTITNPCFAVVESVVAPSPRIAANTNSTNVHFKRIARVEELGSQTTKIAFSALGDYGDAYRSVIQSGFPGIYNPIFAAAWKVANSDMLTEGFESLKARKVGRYVEYIGVTTIDSFAVGKVFEVPDFPGSNDVARLLPAKLNCIVVPLAVVGAGPGFNYLLEDTAIVSVKPNGDVTLISATYSGSAQAFLIFNHRIPLF